MPGRGTQEPALRRDDGGAPQPAAQAAAPQGLRGACCAALWLGALAVLREGCPAFVSAHAAYLSLDDPPGRRDRPNSQGRTVPTGQARMPALKHRADSWRGLK